MDRRIEKPVSRSRFRRKLGREYFIFKRRWDWWFGEDTWSTKKDVKPFEYNIKAHKSMILRPLKDVRHVPPTQQTQKPRIGNCSLKRIDHWNQNKAFHFGKT